MRTCFSHVLATGAVGALLVLSAACDKSDPTAPAMSRVLLAANPRALTLDVDQDGTSNITATVLDKDGRSLSGFTVNFSTTSGNLRSGGAGVETDGNGDAKDVLTLHGGDEDAMVKARAAGATEGTVTVSVNAPGENVAPTAAISGGNITPLVGTAFTASGTNSRDSDGSIIRYDWDFGDGGVNTNNAAPTQDHTYTRTGTFTITLTVYDDGDGTGCSATTHLCNGTRSGTATITATVSTPNRAPTALIQGGSFSATALVQFTLNAAPSNDPDGVIVRHDWAWGDGLLDTNVTTQTQTHTYTRSGTFTVTLTVYDNGDSTGCDTTTHLCHDTKTGTTTAIATVGP